MQRSITTPGDVEVEVALMGSWICSRTIFGKSSGYATDWCDLELVSAGEVYYCPAGPPGHRLEAPDGAKTLDYTPVADIGSIERQADWRRTAFPSLLGHVPGAPAQRTARLSVTRRSARRSWPLRKTLVAAVRR